MAEPVKPQTPRLSSGQDLRVGRLSPVSGSVFSVASA